MTHYVCAGSCGGESVLPGVCDISNCVKTGKPLIECKCTDGKHESINHLRNGLTSASSDGAKANN